MEPGHLGRLVYIRKNWHLYDIKNKELWDIYVAKYSKNGKLGSWEENSAGFDENEDEGEDDDDDSGSDA
jgi:hypothetical protein